MQKLDELGCQSIWIGFCGAQPQRLYSPQMADLAEDETLTNFVVSSMVNKLGEYDWFTMAIMWYFMSIQSCIHIPEANYKDNYDLKIRGKRIDASRKGS